MMPIFDGRHPRARPGRASAPDPTKRLKTGMNRPLHSFQPPSAPPVLIGQHLPWAGVSIQPTELKPVFSTTYPVQDASPRLNWTAVIN